MIIELLAIGDEILLGQIDNTNAAWIAKRLSREGFQVRWMSVVPDDEDLMIDAFQRAFRRSDALLITGGLGPTPDDKTKSVLARFFDLPIVYRNDIMGWVRELHRDRQLELLESTREQAEFPEGATPIRNRHGTAPGIWVERDSKVFVAMPGVPAEMKTMMEEFIMPRLLKRPPKGESVYFKTFHTIGSREAELHNLLKADLRDIEALVELAFLPSYSGVRLRITSKGEKESSMSKLAQAEDLIRSNLGTAIVGTGENFTPETALGELLRGNRLMLAVAESCTGGLFAKRITDTPGSSQWFERGFVTYSNDAKHELLGVPYDLIEKHGAVSAEVATDMAEGALRNSRAQVAVSITGIAGPDGGTEEKPVGLVYIGYANRKGSTVEEHHFGQDRTVNRMRSVAAAISLIFDQLSPGDSKRDPHYI